MDLRIAALTLTLTLYRKNVSMFCAYDNTLSLEDNGIIKQKNLYLFCKGVQ